MGMGPGCIARFGGAGLDYIVRPARLILEGLGSGDGIWPLLLLRTCGWLEEGELVLVVSGRTWRE